MAGHSHWAGIKHKKAVIDKKRSKLWSKLSKAIIVAAQMGGGDPDMNIRLRTAIADAKAVSMPKDNIERAIKKGSGGLEGQAYEEVLYEGYGPGGVALLVEIATDNRNRTAPEIRKIFEVHDGRLGASGCVAWMFDRKGLFLVAAPADAEEQLIETALAAGADDVRAADEAFEVSCRPEQFADLADALEAAGFDIPSKQIARVPQSLVDVDDLETARKLLKFVETLDDHDDVQNVFANFNLPEAALEP